jgi:hypothetical protein
MKYLFFLFLLFSGLTYAKSSLNVPPAADSIQYLNGAFNISCAAAFSICKLTVHEFDFNYDYEAPQSRGNDSSSAGGAPSGRCTVQPLYYKFNYIASSGNFNLLVESSNATYTLYGPFSSDKLTNCELIESYQAEEFSDSLVDGSSQSIAVENGFYILKVIPENCNGVITINFNDDKAVNCDTEKLCSECVTSFSPKSGKYIVSAWVKEDQASATTTTYTKPSIKIHFNQSTTATYTLLAEGRIIDGWQKIESVIVIPSGANFLELKFQVSSGYAFFDDVRFFPTDGSMMSYVYDPISLRLMAELDERNYATLYEYDEEGKLIRIKKETEKGIMTIQENRDNIRKN